MHNGNYLCSCLTPRIYVITHFVTRTAEGHDAVKDEATESVVLISTITLYALYRFGLSLCLEVNTVILARHYVVVGEPAFCDRFNKMLCTVTC